jgi:hypothetical protein
MPPVAAHTRAIATSGTMNDSPKWAKNSLNACMTPAVRDRPGVQPVRREVGLMA